MRPRYEISSCSHSTGQYWPGLVLRCTPELTQSRSSLTKNLKMVGKVHASLNNKVNFQKITTKLLPVSIGLKNACKISLSGNLTRTTTCKEEYRTYWRNNILHQNQIPSSCCVFCISLGAYDCVVGIRYPA